MTNFEKVYFYNIENSCSFLRQSVNIFFKSTWSYNFWMTWEQSTTSNFSYCSFSSAKNFGTPFTFLLRSSIISILTHLPCFAKSTYTWHKSPAKTVSSSFSEVCKASFKCKFDKNPSKSLLKYLHIVSE